LFEPVENFSIPLTLHSKNIFKSILPKALFFFPSLGVGEGLREMSIKTHPIQIYSKDYSFILQTSFVIARPEGESWQYI